MALAKINACFFLFVALIGGLLLVSLPPINDHAIARHGEDAFKSHAVLSNYNPDPRRDDDVYFEGTDEAGRTYHVLRLPKLPGRAVMWAVVITCGTIGGQCVVTAFLCGSKKYVERIKDDCE
jgi:hypothetical protein